jgi:hypothetical protein
MLLKIALVLLAAWLVGVLGVYRSETLSTCCSSSA